jgi:hypothetical protein
MSDLDWRAALMSLELVPATATCLHVERCVRDAETKRLEMKTSRVKGSKYAMVRCLKEMCLCGFFDRFSFLYVYGLLLSSSRKSSTPKKLLEELKIWNEKEQPTTYHHVNLKRNVKLKPADDSCNQ